MYWDMLYSTIFQTEKKSMVTGPIPTAKTIEMISSIQRIIELKTLCFFIVIQIFFIPVHHFHSKQSGWNAFANFSIVSPVIELANTSQRFTEIILSFAIAGTAANAGFSFNSDIFCSKEVSP